MRQIAVCDTCCHKHAIDFDPALGAGAAYSDWLAKHSGHRVRFLSPRRRQRDAVEPARTWDSYLSNSDVKAAYSAFSAVSITLASLAASSSLLSGRESTAIDNTSNKYLDYLISGHYRTGASNLQVGVIRTAVVGWENDTPTWPDVFDGTDSAETVSLASIYDAVCPTIKDIATDATQRTWPFQPVAIAGFFGGGVVPGKFVVFVSHSAHTSTNVWSATEGDHGISIQGVYATVLG